MNMRQKIIVVVFLAMPVVGIWSHRIVRREGVLRKAECAKNMRGMYTHLYNNRSVLKGSGAEDRLSQILKRAEGVHPRCPAQSLQDEFGYVLYLPALERQDELLPLAIDRFPHLLMTDNEAYVNLLASNGAVFTLLTDIETHREWVEDLESGRLPAALSDYLK